MERPIYNFGDIVVVHKNLIGVVVKSWYSIERNVHSHEVYIRSCNSIEELDEDKISRFIYDKEIED